MGAILAQPDHLLALVGVTGGTGARAVLGLLDVGFAPSQLRVLSRSPLQPSCEALAAIGVQVVHADLDDEDSLPQALQGVTAVYCHSTVGDTAKLETAEVERARTLAAAAAACGTVKLLVYNSAATTNKCPRVDRSRQKQDAEEVFRSQPGLPCTMLRATLFMEEFWKKYGDASVCLRSPMVATSTALPVCSNWGRCASSRAHTHSPRHDRVSSKGKFPFAVPPTTPIYLASVRDMGRLAGTCFCAPETFAGRVINVASDVRTPEQVALPIPTCIHHHPPVMYTVIATCRHSAQLLANATDPVPILSSCFCSQIAAAFGEAQRAVVVHTNPILL
eukprot:scaffold66919_cov28-Tisochrysis_lutea.AAC.1